MGNCGIAIHVDGPLQFLDFTGRFAVYLAALNLGKWLHLGQPHALDCLFGRSDDTAVHILRLRSQNITPRLARLHVDSSKYKSFMTDEQGRAFAVEASVIIEAKSDKLVSVSVPVEALFCYFKRYL